MKKIKILYMGLSPNLGGIEKYLINISRNIDYEKFEVDFLVFKGEKVCFYDEIIKKSNIYEITPRTENYIKYIKELKKFLKNGTYDYIHFNLMEFSCFEGIIYARKFTNSKVILHSHIANHETISLKTKVLNKIGEKLIQNKDTYLKVACSDDAGKYMFRGFKNENFTILYNGINVKEFEFNNIDREKLRKKLKIDEKFVIGNIGRLVKQKNHLFLIEILNQLIKMDKNIVLLMIGNGNLRDEINNKVLEYGLKDNILYIDNTNEINKYMCAMDSFVFPSLYEGLGIVLIEAQSSGLKCYITNTLPQEIDVTRNINRISLNNSPQYWAKQILKDKNNEIDRKAQNIVVNNSDFNISNSIYKLEEYYIRHM